MCKQPASADSKVCCGGGSYICSIVVKVSNLAIHHTSGIIVRKIQQVFDKYDFEKVHENS